MIILAYLFGIGAMVSLFLIYQQKSRKGIIMSKLSADIFWVAHYFCLGAKTGIVPNLVGIFRELVFMRRKEKKWARSVLWPVLFAGLNLFLGLRTYTAWYCLLPVTASLFVTISLWIDNPVLTKIISAPASASFLIYDIFVGSYIGVVNEIVSLCSIAIYFIRK